MFNLMLSTRAGVGVELHGRRDDIHPPSQKAINYGSWNSIKRTIPAANWDRHEHGGKLSTI